MKTTFSYRVVTGIMVVFCLAALFACGGGEEEAPLLPTAPTSWCSPGSQPPPDPSAAVPANDTQLDREHQLTVVRRSARQRPAGRRHRFRQFDDKPGRRRRGQPRQRVFTYDRPGLRTWPTPSPTP
jgi:hypothetical protein